MNNLQTDSHPSEHLRNFLNTKKLELRARRKARLALISNKNKKLTYSLLPSSQIKALQPKIFKNINEKQQNEWALMPASENSKNTINPIRKICDSLAVPHNKFKKPIYLNLGDPTLTGNLPPSNVAIKALHDVIDSHKFDGYGPSVGIQSAREAVVKHFSTFESPFTADDVILSSGCSHALEMSIVAIANNGDNILVPIPGFPLYSTICKPSNIEARQYRLRMNIDGLIELKHLEELIDSKTKAIIVNNPSNPTGVVFPKEHLEAILKIAYKHKVPIIADEIYGDLVYNNAKFYSMASLSPKVPIISCDGIAKRYLVPGWRLGWAIVHDRYGVLSNVKKGIIALSQKIVGPCALIQGALPKILDETPQSYFDNIKQVISTNASIVYDILSHVPGLKPLRPQGAMYMMVGFEYDIYGDETEFVQRLITEESIYCLPGSAFNFPNWFRLVLTYPRNVTREACERIAEFCKRQLRSGNHLLTFCQPKITRTIDEGSEGSISNTESDD